MSHLVGLEFHVEWRKGVQDAIEESSSDIQKDEDVSKWTEGVGRSYRM